MTDLAHIIGETTDYDKKQQLEIKNQRAGARVFPLLQMGGEALLFLAWLMMTL